MTDHRVNTQTVYSVYNNSDICSYRKSKIISFLVLGNFVSSHQLLYSFLPSHFIKTLISAYEY